MSVEFDPYYKWLGIPPTEQPPNHYRLLGIQLFEPDPDVISNAADQRMTHVRTFQSGKYSKASQRLLNEISTARVLLLSPTKEQYDRNLRSSVAATDAQPSARPLAKAKPTPARRAKVPSAEPRSTESAKAFEPIVNVAEPAHDMTRRKSAPPAWQNPALLAVVGVVTFLVICGVVYLLVGNSENGVVARQPDLPTGNGDPTRTQQTSAQDETPTSTDPAPVNPNSNSTPIVSDQSPNETPDKPPVDTLGPQPPVDPPKNQTDLPSDDPPDDAPITPRPLEEATAKRPVPDAATVEQKRDFIAELFQAEITEAKTDDDKLALAQQWIQTGNETNDDDAARYVLLQLAAQAAVNIGDVETAMTAIDGMDSFFEVDAWQLKISALTAISKAKGIDFKQRNQQVADVAAGLLVDATAEGQLESADDLLNIALASARTAKDYSLIKELVVRKKEIDELAQLEKDATDALALLKTDPADPSANLIAGRYLCFVKDDWPAGLPLLAKTNDAALKRAAEMETAMPSTADDQVTLGDAWWDLAESESGLVKNKLQSRSVHWYEKALPLLSDGLARVKLRNRLSAIGRAVQTNHALAFDGKGTYVSVPKLNYDGSTPVTVEACLYPQAKSMSHAVILGDPHGEKLALKIGGIKRWEFGCVNESNPATYRESYGRPIVEWNTRTHVAGTWDGMRLRLFVNGKLVSTSPLVLNLTPQGSLLVGSDVDPSWTFLGVIDELRISSVVRYDDDYQISDRFEPDQHTLALYHFDEGQGNIARDSSKNGYHGTIHGAKWVKVDQLSSQPPSIASNEAATERAVDLTGAVLAITFDRGHTLANGGINRLRDLTGKGNHVTVVGDPQALDGVANQAMPFDGNSTRGYVDRMIQEDFSISFWMRSTQQSRPVRHFAGGVSLIDAEVPGFVDDFGIALSDGRVMFGIGNPDTNLQSKSPVTDGRWHHICAVRQQATGKFALFIDGRPEATGVASTKLLDSPQRIGFGQRGNTQQPPDAPPYQGLMDELAIFDRVLSAEEVQTLYGGGGRVRSLTELLPKLSK